MGPIGLQHSGEIMDLGMSTSYFRVRGFLGWQNDLLGEKPGGMEVSDILCLQSPRVIGVDA